MLSVFECLKIVGIFFDPLLFYDIFLIINLEIPWFSGMQIHSCA